MATEKEATFAHCNRCLGRTRHTILEKQQRLVGEDYAPEVYTYEMRTCDGCENVTFRVVYSNSDDRDEFGNPKETETYYPPAISRRQPDWVSELCCIISKRRDVRAVYLEYILRYS
jgi:hypothetical protein